MKWGCISIIFLLLAGSTAWLLLSQKETTGVENTTTEHTQPAPYPPDMWNTATGSPRVDICKAAPLPQDAGIVWQNGAQAPPLGDTRARRGGVLRVSNVGPFPANFLAFGSPSPQFFHYNLFDCINTPLVRQHPLTGDIVPGLAEAWAKEGRTIHFRLHRQARYSNGRPVRAADFALGAKLRFKAGKDGAWQRLAELIEKLEIRGEHTLSVTLRKEQPLAPLLAAEVLAPAEPGFYAEFGSDYAVRYAARIPPTTGAYTIQHVQRGRMIRLQRVANWWGDSIVIFRHTCNVDAIEYHFLTDEAQAWELLHKGRLNLLQTRHTAGWLQRREEHAAHRHLQFTRCDIHRAHPPYGIAINARAIPHIELRRGIACALDMNKAIAHVFCGEYERLAAFATGYSWQRGSEPAPPAFSPAQAQLHFAKAGFTKRGADGILQRRDGTRLSFSLLYPPSGRNTTLMSILAEQARLCGLELRPEAAAWQLSSRMMQEQKHQLLFWATAPARHLPDFARHFAPEASGHDAPFALRSHTLQQLLQRYAACTNTAEAATLCHDINTEIARECIWIPAWKENRALTAHSAEVKFPANHRLFNTCDVADSHLLWIEP